MNPADAADFSVRTQQSTARTPAGGASYRRSHRTVAHAPLAIYPRTPRGGRVQRKVARLRDYSTTGIGLVSNEAVEPGTQFAVRLVRPDGSRLALAFEVVYCRPSGRNTYHLGAKLPERPQAVGRTNFERSITGKTVSGWERVLDIRAEDDRLWINMHPPDRESGWGMFLNRDEVEAALAA